MYLGLLQIILVLYIYIILIYIYKHIVPYITIFSCSWYTFLYNNLDDDQFRR